MTGLLDRNHTVILLYVFSALFVFGIWVVGTTSPYTSMNGDPRSKVSDLINGTAHNPFVQRALIPILTRSVNTIVPQSLKSEFSTKLINIPRFHREIERLGWEEEFLPQYLIAFTFVFLSLLGWMFVIRELFGALYQTSLILTNIIPVVAVYCLPVMFHSGTHYLYDFPSIFFFTTGLYLIIQRKWVPFYLVYALGCINKETTVLLTVAFALIYFRNLGKPAFFKHVSTQLLIFSIVKSALMIVYSGNPGKNLEFHFFGNLYNLFFPMTIVTLLFFVIFTILIFYEIKNKPLVLRRTFFLIVPFFALTFTFGVLEEVRAMYEIFSVVFLLLVHTIFFSIFKIPCKVRPSLIP